jgi:hypothetical protein
VIDGERAPDRRAGVDVDPRLPVRELGEEPRDERDREPVKRMRQAVAGDGVEAG